MSSEPNSSLKVEPILVKLYPVAVYNLRMCMKEDIPSNQNIKGDNSR